MPINDYWSILKHSYRVTIHNPVLWLLGLFLAGGFNINFFYWANLRLRWRTSGEIAVNWLQQNLHTTHAVIGGGAVIIGVAAIIILANWAKVVFVLHTSNILKLKRMRPSVPDNAEPVTAVRESPNYLFSVTCMSLFTMVATAVVVTVLGGASQVLFDSRGVIWLVAALVFVAFVFFFSCLNIFASFFIIFYRKQFGAALNLSLDLIVSRSLVIFEMAIILMVVYGLCFFAGTSILFIFRTATIGLLGPLVQNGLVSAGAYYGLITALSGLLLWVWLAMVNTFFNVSLLLLFTRLVQPPYHPEFKSLLANLPAAMPGPAAS